MPNRLVQAGARHPRRSATLLVAVVAGATVLAMAGMAIAKSFTLNVAKNATVMNGTAHTTKHEAIVVNTKGFAVYWLTGDSKSHPECTKANQCFSFWPPVTAASAKSLGKASGVKGKLTTWTRNGFVQAVLGGHPLYTFAPDTKRDDATGEGVVGFGGTWHVAVPGDPKPASTPAPSNPAPMGTNPYPQGY
jgi:predicted lipoprotein with Yx(FWY)xxD motif